MRPNKYEIRLLTSFAIKMDLDINQFIKAINIYGYHRVKSTLFYLYEKYKIVNENFFYNLLKYEDPVKDFFDVLPELEIFAKRKSE